MSKINPSPYQIEIFKFITNEKGNAIINAVAGSGKTTTIVNAVNLIKGRSKLKIAFVAFNNHIVNELKSRLPSGITISTMHKIGFNCLIKAFDGKKPKIDEYNWTVRDNILKLAVSDQWFPGYDKIEDREVKEMMLQNIKRYCLGLSELVSLCKATMSLKKTEIEITAHKYGFDELNIVDFERIEHFFYTYYRRPNLSEITLDDMIFLPAIEAVEMNKYDYVFVDECQDLNKAQQVCLDLMLKPSGRLIAVGDPQQAIYGFAGADSESFKNIANRPNTKNLPLSVCYRCGKEIIKFTQTIMPSIETHDRAHSAIVRYGSYKEINYTDFVLCRYNAPLVNLWFDLLRENKKATIKGGNIGKHLVSVIQSNKAISINGMFINLYRGLENLSANLSAKGLTKKQIESNLRYKDKMDEIQVLQVIGEKCSSIEELIGTVDAIFSEEIEGITLSSIHKAKGLEAEKVFILIDDFSPSVKASKPWEVEQENNLIYVAYTRAKKELIFINDFENIEDVKLVMLNNSSRFDEYIDYSNQ